MRVLLISAAVLTLASPAFAGPQVATLAAIQGEVKIFSNPSKDSPEGPPPHAKYEGLYYSVRDAKVGDRVEKGNIIRTQTGGRARVIYDNGDQIYVAAASSYKIDWDKDANDANPELELRYGKARFVIQKGGPRSKFRIKTKSAVLGVRGTDFFVAVNEATGETETATLRGAVEVKPPVEAAQGTTVPAGQTASVAQAPETGAAQPPAVQVHQTTKAELQAVQRNTVLTSPEPTPPPAAEQVKTLETAAEKATIEDIRAVDPATAQKLDQLPADKPHLDEINKSTIDNLEKKAPAKGAVGPIADASLEKPKEPPKAEEKKVDEKKPEAGEPEPVFPRLWVGLKGGPNTETVDGGNNSFTGNVGVDHKSSDGGAVALTAEWELGRNGSLFAELYPRNQHGAQFNVYCGGGSCPTSGLGNYRLRMDSIDFFAGLKPQLPFGRTRWLVVHAAVGVGFIHLTSATLDGPSQQDIFSGISHNHLQIGGGFGVTIKPFTRFKISAELRATHSLSDLTSGQPVTIGAASMDLGGFGNVYGLLGVAVGF